MIRGRTLTLAFLAIFLGGATLSAGDGGDLFLRGDANDDGAVNIGDPVHTLAFLFTSGPAPNCFDAADSNDDGSINIGDPVSTLGFLFSGSGPLPPPSAAPGTDPTPDGMLCGAGCTDIWYLDADLDGYGNPLVSLVDCAQPSGYVANDDDCDDAEPDIHPGATEICDTFDNDCDGDVDEGGVCANQTSLQIELARNTGDGPVSLPIDDARVTFAKPAIGIDPAGFFIQAETQGPALFIAVDPATLSPSPGPGDVVSFTILEMGTTNTLRQATSIGGFSLDSDGVPADAAFLIQDVTAVDLPLQLGLFESESITATVTIAGNFAAAGGGFVSALVDNAVVVGSPDLRLRVPTALATDLNLDIGCTVTVTAPLWRFNTQAQISAWSVDDISLDSCPPITVVSAVASSPTEVVVLFDRFVDGASLLANGSQFTFDGGLLAVGALVSVDAVIVFTTAQTPGASYTVTVASTLLDVFGQGVALPNSAVFTGFSTPAQVRINELNANVTSGCDLIELRVVQGGSLEGLTILERTDVVMTFPAFTVATNDIIVIHFDSADTLNCNPGGSGNEIGSVIDFPAAGFPNNYDFAYDWHVADTGITATDNVITLLDPLGVIVEALLVADDPLGTAAAASETQAAVVAAAGAWTTPLGTVPPGGFIDDDFCANSVQDLNGTTITQAGTSIQRSDDTDTNHLGGWTMGASTWGTINGGQIPF